LPFIRSAVSAHGVELYAPIDRWYMGLPRVRLPDFLALDHGIEIGQKPLVLE
jgi:hypothetical protein